MDTESLAQIRQIINESSQGLREEIQENLAETRRHTGVLVEDLHHKLDLVVEEQQCIQESLKGDILLFKHHPVPPLDRI